MLSMAGRTKLAVHAHQVSADNVLGFSCVACIRGICIEVDSCAFGRTSFDQSTVASPPHFGDGMQTILKDMGIVVKIQLTLDASAALGVLQRQGVGKIRHLEVGALWLQEKETQRRFTTRRCASI